MIYNFKQIVLAVILQIYEEENSMAFTEELLLPSRGIVYQLPDFNGVVSVKPFTTKAYKDLLTSNASEAGLKQFVDTCLVDCPVKAKNMNQHDFLAVLFKIRAITLGNILKTQTTCPECGHVEDIERDLNDIEVNYLYAENYPISIKLPKSGTEIKVRLATGADAAKAKQEADRRSALFKKPASEFLATYTIVSLLDVGSKDIIEKAEWFETLSPQDAIFINGVLSKLTDAFGVKLLHEDKCAVCDKFYSSSIDIWGDFFRPDANISLGITSKAGNLAGLVEKPDISE